MTDKKRYAYKLNMFKNISGWVFHFALNHPAQIVSCQLSIQSVGERIYLAMITNM